MVSLESGSIEIPEGALSRNILDQGNELRLTGQFGNHPLSYIHGRNTWKFIKNNLLSITDRIVLSASNKRLLNPNLKLKIFLILLIFGLQGNHHYYKSIAN